MKAWRASHPELAREWDRYWNRDLPEGWIDELVAAGHSDSKAATRKLSGSVIQKLAEIAPWIVGGSADLAPSNDTNIDASGSLARAEDNAEAPPLDAFRNRNLHFGIREHAMGAIVNGLTLHGPWRAYGGTFLIFSDYMRASVRLAALMNIPSIFVYTHDSVFLGEDGPTHQPIEQLWSLRAIPNLRVFRPADGVEVAMAWAWAVAKSEGPSAMALT